MSVMLYPCMLCVALLMCLFVCCVFVNCLVKQFAMCLGVVAILLLNVMDVFSVCGGALLDIPCMVFQRVCVLWSPHLLKSVYPLEKVQRSFTKHITGMHTMSYEERLKHLNLYSNQRRQDKYIIIY